MTTNPLTPRLAFDERALTVNVALALWTGLAAGAIVALGGFDAPSAWDNGYVRLAALGLTAAALAMAFHAGDTPAGKRIQLGVVLSLIVHTGLLAALSLADLRMMQLVADADAPIDEEVLEDAPPELITIDRTHLDEKPDFERPLETAAPQMQALVESPEHQAPKLPDSMRQPAQAPTPELPTPDALDISRPQAALSRADIESGRRSRSVAASAGIAPAPEEVDLGVLLSLESEPEPREQPRPTPLALQPTRPTLATALPQVAKPQADVTIPIESSSSGLPARRSTPGVAAGPILAPAPQPAVRPRVLAQLGPTPDTFIAPATASSSEPAASQKMIRLSPGSITPQRSEPAMADLAPRPQAIAAPAQLPAASQQPSIAAPRPDRLAMRGGGHTPSILSDARPRGRSAPLASLGAAGKALDAPSEMLGSTAGQQGNPADIDAAPGAGGLGMNPADTAGLDRTASRDAANLAPGRFRTTPSGGSPSIAGDARRPAAAFSSRGDRPKQLESGSAGSPSARTEAAIELGLKFIASLQQPDGSWAFDKLGGLEKEQAEIAQIQADGAATGLALLAFLGAGYDHIDGRYQDTVKRGLDYLLSQQTGDGLIFPEGAQPDAWQVARFYSHGIASIALCEAYGMTGDPRLERPAQRALDYIVNTQVEGRGGWRYTPGFNSDLSVTGWMVMALRSGELAGLRVPTRTYAGVRRFLESCREKAGYQARFCYNPQAPADDPRTSHGRNPGTVMTSVGLLLQLYLGEGRESERTQRGADHLMQNLPTIGDSLSTARTSTLGNPMRDTYYWYYGTQVMFHVGGDHWRAWNDALHPLLINSQKTVGPLAGSWNPLRPVPDKWRHLGGRLYVTAMNLLSLEVYYRHLPLYEMTAK